MGQGFPGGFQGVAARRIAASALAPGTVVHARQKAYIKIDSLPYIRHGIQEGRGYRPRKKGS